MEDKYIRYDIYNEHSIITELKRYIYKVEQVKNMYETDILLSEVKSFIYQCPTLKEYYIKQLQEFKHFQNINRDYGEIIKETVCKYAIENNKKNEIGLNIILAYTLGEFLYFPALKYMVNSKIIKHKKSIFEFYESIVTSYILSKDVSLQIQQNIREFLTNEKTKTLCQYADFYILSLEDVIPFTYFPNFKDEFYQEWVLSALLGVLYNLKLFMRNKIGYDFKENGIDFTKEKKVINQQTLNFQEYKLDYNESTETFLLNKKVLLLRPADKHSLKILCGIVKNESVNKQQVNSLNTALKKVLGNNNVTQKKSKEKPYKLNEDIINFTRLL